MKVLWSLNVLWSLDTKGTMDIYLYPGGAQSRALIEKGNCSTKKATPHEDWAEGSGSQFQLYQQWDFGTLSCLG